MQKLVVDSVSMETEKIRTIVLRANGHDALPEYSAGAHVDFDLGELGTRSYSLITWPGANKVSSTYAIAVQLEEDGTGGSRIMHALEPGQTIFAATPKNDFELQATSDPVVLLAGGIGVTPIISMATSLQSGNVPFEIHYCGRRRALMGFADQLQRNFPDQLNIHCDDETPLDLSALMSSQSARTHVYICGPKGMIEAAKSAALAAGLPDTNVHVELFTTPQVTSGDTAFEVEIHDTGAVYTVPVGKTIVEVLEEAGVDVMYDCQRGDCGICQTDIISGIPDHRDVVLSRADRDAGKVMQICVSRAKSARLILDI